MQQPADRMHDGEMWLQEYGDFLFRYAWRRLQRRDVAEDLVQETLLSALSARESFSGKSSHRTWLLGILKHKLVDHIRRADRELPFEEKDLEALPREYFDEKGRWKTGPSEWDRNPDDAIENKEFWDMFMKCLGELPRKMAHVFVLRELEELDGPNISKTLAISSSNMWVLLHRARLRLRQCLEMGWFGG